jgi:hypothetical protein
MTPTNDATSRSDESEVPMKRIGVPIPCISKPNCEHIEVQRRDFKPIEKILWVSKDRKALDDSARGCIVGSSSLHSERDWDFLQMDEVQTLSVFPEVDLLTRHTSTSLGIYTRDSNGGQTVYLQHPRLSNKDEPSLLRVPPVALQRQSNMTLTNNENLIPIEGEPNHFLVVGTPRPGKRILDPVVGMNPISNFGLAPDETLIMLSKVCNYRLTDEQVSIAKLSGMELLSSATNDEITILELVNLWQDTPALSGFADSLRKNLLPG